MFDKKIETALARFQEVETLLSDPEIIAQKQKFQDLCKEHAQLKNIKDILEERDKVLEEIQDVESTLEDEQDEDMRALFLQEEEELKQRREELQQKMFMLFCPEDPSDSRNVIVEVRAGTGGDEAALFAGEIFQMYTRFSEQEKWRIEVLSLSHSEMGGVKEVIFSIEGEKVYRFMKYEAGIHRVQRVPQTESSGRLHTSAVSVAVLPEAKDVDIQIEAKDLRIDVFRSSGPGGQSVNTMDSAVRITHLPTNVVVSCQDGKSQLQNKNQAMKILRSRLLQHEQEKENKKRADNRREQVGGGDRSEKIRTYNFPQSRVTDHRIPMTLYHLSDFLSGDIKGFYPFLIEKLLIASGDAS